MPEPLGLRENGDHAVVSLDGDVAAALHASRLVTVEPAPGGRWRLTPGLRVGAVRVGTGRNTIDVRVVPKVGVARLLFLLGYAADPGWRDEDVAIDDAEDLLPAVLDALARAAGRALGQGVLQGYPIVEDALPLVRGRILAGVQMSRRFALPLPVDGSTSTTRTSPRTRFCSRPAGWGSASPGCTPTPAAGCCTSPPGWTV